MRLSEVRIAVDGGAATGKTTIAKKLSEKLNITYISTGLMYRFITLKIVEEGFLNKLSKKKEIDKYLEKFENKINFINDSIYYDNHKYDFSLLHSKIVRENVSKVSSNKSVRDLCTSELIKIGERKGVLLEGRDITSVVMKDADVKFFVQTEPEIKAMRRVDQLQKNKLKASYDDILSSVVERDKSDKERKISPLVKTENSITIYNNYFSLRYIVKEMYRVIKKLSVYDFKFTQEIIDEINKYNKELNYAFEKRRKTLSVEKQIEYKRKVEKKNIKLMDK